MSSSTSVSPGTVAADCVCLGLRRAARAVSRRYDEALRPVDLSNGQFSMLVTIAGMQPIGMVALADRLAMDRTTVTAALKPLQRRGLVAVDVSQTDARGREARLTPSGRALFVKALPLWRAMQQELADELPSAQASRLLRQLVQLG